MNQHINTGLKVNKIEFRKKVLSWLKQFDTFCFLDTHDYNLPYSGNDMLIGAGVKKKIESSALASLSEIERNREWWFGFFGYDLKNDIHHMTSTHSDRTGFPDLFFFQPQHVIRVSGDHAEVIEGRKEVIKEIMNEDLYSSSSINVEFTSRENREEYCLTISSLKDHIQRGDCYEINYCTEFFSENAYIDPFSVYSSLSNISPNPFSSFFRYDDRWLMCASPERFLKKEGNNILSQPIKGTSRRFADKDKDIASRQELAMSAKDRSENVMVVDLVRNDLSIVCKEGSVKVDELFGIYEFPQVYQMISTISGELMNNARLTDIIRATFPMGSMTGAPKKRVMELIAAYEKFPRGLFSGAVGYIDPGGDFDFNVVIRSILYNATNKYLSFPVGSGITYYSDPAKEWEECLMKAAAITRVLSS